MTITEEKQAAAKSRRFASLATSLVVVGAAVAALGGSAAYYRYPPFAARLLAHATGKPGFLPAGNAAIERVDRSNWPQSAAKIPASVKAPLSASGEISRIDELRQRPALLIEGATIVFDPGTAGRIAASKLTLRDSTLITNGGDLEIEVETLVAENSEIRAFALTGKPAAKGAGRDAGRVVLRVHGRISGVLRVDLSGEAGAAGAPGRPGLAGSAGAAGATAVSAPEKCLKPAAPGGPGGAGGKGGDGGDGAPGGAGGQLTLAAKEPQEAAGRVEFSAEGGRGGAAGAAGPGGEGGVGGPAGLPAGLCIGDGGVGPRGAQGPAGKAGEPGADGAAGSMKAVGLGDRW